MLSKGNVLVVDDEINLCRILSAKLAKTGYDVVTVHDGEQAVKKVNESHFDVVLLDLILPKMDGLEALSHIRATNRDVPIIIMSACENSKAIEQAMTQGVAAYVNKPFDLDSLVALVQSTSRADDIGRAEQTGRADTTMLFVKSQEVTLDVFNGSAGGQYQSRIEDRDERTVTVLTPVRNGDYVIIPPNTMIRVGLPAKDAFYSFTSPTLGQKREPPVTTLSKPAVIYRTQRRQFARILANVPVRYRSKRGAGHTDEESEWKAGKSLDFSAGGAAIAVDEDMAPGTSICLETDPISDIGVVSVVGKVVRSCKEDSENGFTHTLGVQFDAVNSDLKSVS